jgi:thiamine biosynthesis lipoprotein
MKPSKTAYLKRAKPLLGTWVIVAVKSPDPARSNLAIDAAFQAVAKVQRLMSAHDETSDVGRIARQEAFRPFSIDPWTYDVLSLGEKVSWLSGGVFDVTIGGKLAQKGFLPLAGLMPLTGLTPGDGFFTRARYTDIELLPDSRLVLMRPCRVDLGGIAKGYAVDRALEAALEIEGVSDVVINAGGDLRIKTHKPQEIWLRDPFQPDRFWPQGLSKEGAFASSGGREAQRESLDCPATPIMEPGSDRLRRVLPGVTVEAGQCALADALTKVVLLGPPATARKTLEHFKAKAYMAVDETGYKDWNDGHFANAPSRVV